VESADGPKVRLADGSLIAIAAKGVKDGQAVTLGMRPEHLEMSGAGIAGEVLVVEPLGMTTQVAIETACGLLNLMAMQRTSIAPGEKVHLAVAPSNVHVFDRASGRRIA
jgi:multiple sugar transport system ATP-binding protein